MSTKKVDIPHKKHYIPFSSEIASVYIMFLLKMRKFFHCQRKSVADAWKQRVFMAVPVIQTGYADSISGSL